MAEGVIVEALTGRISCTFIDPVAAEYTITATRAGADPRVVSLTPANGKVLVGKYALLPWRFKVTRALLEGETPGPDEGGVRVLADVGIVPIDPLDEVLNASLGKGFRAALNAVLAAAGLTAAQQKVTTGYFRDAAQAAVDAQELDIQTAKEAEVAAYKARTTAQ